MRARMEEDGFISEGSAGFSPAWLGLISGRDARAPMLVRPVSECVVGLAVG